MKITRTLAIPFLLLTVLLVDACAAPRFWRSPFRRGEITATNTLTVRTTAYLAKRNALSQKPSFGKVTSAASDWSQFPVGTRFRLEKTGQVYVIDDYGSALIGTRTIDLCMPSARAMHAWGVRRLQITILEWGSPQKSMEILSPRKNWMARRMLAGLKKQTPQVPDKFRKKGR